jgi:hypothetical protein
MKLELEHKIGQRNYLALFRPSVFLSYKTHISKINEKYRGTSFSVAISEDPDISKIIESSNFPTTTPEETLARVVSWWAPRLLNINISTSLSLSSTNNALRLKDQKFDALGVASFGPVDLDPTSSYYGYITTTPKPGWGFTPLLKVYLSGFTKWVLCEREIAIVKNSAIEKDSTIERLSIEKDSVMGVVVGREKYSGEGEG